MADTPIYGIEFGGPSAGVVHQDRLVLVGSGAVPDMLAASRTTNWEDFRLGTNLADPANPVPLTTLTEAQRREPATSANRVFGPQDGFWFQQTSGRGNAFHALLQQEGLFILGDVGESVVPAGPFTSDEVSIRENSWYGSELGRTPIIAGGLVVFLQKGGTDVRGIAWTEAERKYVAPSMLVAAGAVFTEGVDMTFQTSTARHGDTVFVVDANGDLATLLLRVGAQHPAWARWNTGGSESRIVGGAAPLGVLAFLVERNGVLGIELLDEDESTWLDAVWTPTGGDGDEIPFEQRVTLPPRWMWGMAEGVVARIDGGEPLPVEVMGNGRLRTGPENRPGMSNNDFFNGRKVELGLAYTRSVETLPFVADAGTGLKRSVRRVRIMDIEVDCIVRQDSPNREVETEWVSQLQMTPILQRNTRRSDDRLVSAKVHRDTSEIVRCHYGSTRGWRDRIALRLHTQRPVSLAGMSYRSIG